MKIASSFFENLSESDIAQVKDYVKLKEYKKDDLIFSEGDDGDSFYVVQKGLVSIYFDENGKETLANTHEEGGYFGEMGILNNDKRSYSAKAIEDSVLLCFNKKSFLSIMENFPHIAAKIKYALSQRNEELILRETLLKTTGVDSKNLYVSIKGDPSLRETALFRERYESPVDKIIDALKINLEEILLNRCVYHLNVNFNSGEIHMYTVFDPFREKIHIAQTLLSEAYVNRHFIIMPFKEKTALIKNTYSFISQQPQYDILPSHWKRIFTKTSDNWEPLSKVAIKNVIDKLSDLRNIPHFYLRSFSINTIQDTIRLQFNCDGTHILNSGDYGKFLDDNFAI